MQICEIWTGGALLNQYDSLSKIHIPLKKYEYQVKYNSYLAN